jgi:hypothetical protein
LRDGPNYLYLMAGLLVAIVLIALAPPLAAHRQ